MLQANYKIYKILEIYILLILQFFNDFYKKQMFISMN